MSKGGRLAFVFIFLAIIFLSFASSQTSDEIFRKADVCLEKKINDTSMESFGLEPAVFSILANMPHTKLGLKINSTKSSSEECWPNTGCTIKDTALVVLAKELQLNENTTGAVNWLRSKVGVTEDLNWFLQITTSNNGAAQCTVNYGEDQDHEVIIDEETKVSGGGPCLEVDDSGYRFKITDSCVNEVFSIKCQGDFNEFKTNLLYKEIGGDTLFVSANTHTKDVSSGEWTREEIIAKCFQENGKCDYEGTLWGAAAIYEVDGKTSEFAPYLRALASSNEKYFPSAFLFYVLEETGGTDDEYNKILSSAQKRPNDEWFWEMPNSPHGEFYDTSLAMLALGGKDESHIETHVLPWLETNQDADGCWKGGEIRDTAFILYSSQWLRGGGSGSGDGSICGDGDVTGNEVCDIGEDLISGTGDDETGTNSCVGEGWDGGDLNCDPGCAEFNTTQCTGSGPPPPPPGDGGGDEEEQPQTACEEQGLYCAPNRWDCFGAGGQIRTEFSCANQIEFCCTVNVVPDLRTCSEMLGRACGEGEQCSTSTTPSSDEAACCTGTCTPIGEDGGDSGGGQDGGTDTDDEGTESGGSGLITFIVILVILIVLAILGIIFKDKLRVWWFKMRGKAKSSKVKPSDEGPMAAPLMRRTPQRFGPSTPMQRPLARPAMPANLARPTRTISKDKDMEETLRKLKKMSE